MVDIFIGYELILKILILFGSVWLPRGPVITMSEADDSFPKKSRGSSNFIGTCNVD